MIPGQYFFLFQLNIIFPLKDLSNNLVIFARVKQVNCMRFEPSIFAFLVQSTMATEPFSYIHSIT